ncbi:MAG TPA: hypothetical protein VLA04_00380 [Verrucomicrobiae bacterium]|nr:hypothetical protein [Verrucomicrobiae bacterium]
MSTGTELSRDTHPALAALEPQDLTRVNELRELHDVSPLMLARVIGTGKSMGDVTTALNVFEHRGDKPSEGSLLLMASLSQQMGIPERFIELPDGYTLFHGQLRPIAEVQAEEEATAIAKATGAAAPTATPTGYTTTENTDNSELILQDLLETVQDRILDIDEATEKLHRFLTAHYPGRIPHAWYLSNRDTKAFMLEFCTFTGIPVEEEEEELEVEEPVGESDEHDEGDDE